MVTIAPLYLEKVRPSAQQTLFFAGHVDGTRLVAYQGIKGGRVREISQEFDWPQTAVKELERLVRTRRQEGYRPVDPENAHRAAVVEDEPPELSDEEGLPYSLYWEANKPLNMVKIHSAVTDSQRMLRILAERNIEPPVSITTKPTHYGPLVQMRDNQGHTAEMGFIPDSLFGRLSKAEVNAVKALPYGYKGYLTPNGCGHGAIQTDGHWVDFIARFFLGRLLENEGVVVTCDKNLEYSLGFSYEDELTHFEWANDFHYIKPQFVDLGLLSGSTSFRFELASPDNQSSVDSTW